MSHTTLVYGPAGTIKSSFAGSNPAILNWWAELDAGGFERAGFNKDDPRFQFHEYHPPLAALLDFGRMAFDTKGQVVPHNQRTEAGYMALADQLRDEFMEALISDSIGQITFDTATILWELFQNARDEEVRLAGKNDQRLGQLRYTEPNRWMRGFISAPKVADKDFVMTCHAAEEWKGTGEARAATGNYIPKGFGEMENYADVVLRMLIVGKKPVGRIMKVGRGGLSLIGMEIEEPTLPKLYTLLDAADMIRAAGLSVPEEYEEVVELGRSLA